MKIRIAIFTIISLVILLLALVTGFTLLWRLFLLALFTLFAGFLWAFLGIRGIEGQAERLPPRYQVGDTINEEIVLTNKSRLPKLLVQLQENTSLPAQNKISALNLPALGSSSLHKNVYCAHRGQYSLGSFTVSISDPFGLFQTTRSIGQPQNILICPATVDLPYFEPLSHYDPGRGTGRWLASKASTNVASVREYTTGDSLRYLHWHSTAHTGKLMVKVFDPDRSGRTANNVWIVLDMDRSAHLGDSDQNTEEYSVTLAASLIKKYIYSGWPVGLLASGDQPYLFPPGLGDQHFWQMQTALGLMKATGKVSIDQLVSSESGRFGIHSLVIVISPSHSERLASSLRQVTNHGSIVVAVLFDTASFGESNRPGNITPTLTSNGVQVHTISRGKDLARALDSRTLLRI